MGRIRIGEKIDWSNVTWQIDGKHATPDFGKSIADHSMGHKSLVRFWTPGLDGFKGSLN